MKKRILFLFNDRGYSKPKSSAGFVAGLNALTEKSQVYLAGLEMLQYRVSPTGTQIYDANNNLDIKDYDLVYFRSWTGSKAHTGICAQYLKSHDVPFFDSEALTTRSYSKLDQYFRLNAARLPIPATVEGTPEYMLSEAGKGELSYPVIIKTNAGGQKGGANFLAANETEAKKILSAPPEDGQFMLQQYIDNDCDYRVLVLGGEVKLIIKRTRDSSKTHLNNTSQGAKAELIELGKFDKRVLKDSIKAAEVMNRQIAGVDVVVEKNTGKHYFFEINRKPQIYEGAFVNNKMAEFAKFLDNKV